VRGLRASQAFGAEPDIKEWADGVALNPARIPPEHRGSPEVQGALERLQTHVAPGLARLTELAGLG
jgi:hypothetical protein